MSRRISPATLLLAIIAVLFGLLGAYVVRQQYQQLPPEEAVVQAPQQVLVPMASTDLKAGRQITLGDVALYNLTAEQLAEQGVTGNYMANTQQIIGRILREDVTKGGTFTPASFYPEGTGPSVAELLEPGQRAVTVPVKVDAAVAGFATPGAWVDVLFRSDADDDLEHPETTITLIERVKVLALNQETFEGTRNRNGERQSADNAAVTLSVDPDQAASLRVVDARGTLSLALRHPEDVDSYIGRAPRTLEELMNIPPVRRHRLDIYRGNRLSKVEFEKGDRVGPSVATIAQGDAAAADAPAADDAAVDSGP